MGTFRVFFSALALVLPAYGFVSFVDLLESSNCTSIRSLDGLSQTTKCTLVQELLISAADQSLLRLQGNTTLVLIGTGADSGLRFTGSDGVAPIIVIDQGSALELQNLRVAGASLGFDHGHFGFDLLQILPSNGTLTWAAMPSLRMLNCTLEVACEDYQLLQNLATNGGIAVNAEVGAWDGERMREASCMRSLTPMPTGTGGTLADH